MTKKLKITTRIGNQRVQIVQVGDEFEVAIVGSPKPSEWAKTLNEALEIMNTMVTTLVWLREGY